SSPTVVGVITPVTDFPATNGPSTRTPNHWPNSSASLIARQTRSSGARRTTCFSIRSILMCNLLVAYHASVVRCESQPFGCVLGNRLDRVGVLGERVGGFL